MVQMMKQHENRYSVVGIRGGSLPGVLHHEGMDYSAAYDAAVAYMRECEAATSTDVMEVRMVRTDYWGEAHISGRWGVHPRS